LVLPRCQVIQAVLVYSTHSKLDKLSACHRLWHASFSSPTLKITALLINPVDFSPLCDTRYAPRLQHDPEGQGKLSCRSEKALAGVLSWGAVVGIKFSIGWPPSLMTVLRAGWPMFPNMFASYFFNDTTLGVMDRHNEIIHAS
jgi:hypothetical protein